MTTTPLLLAAVCVNGLRELAWVLASEIQNDPPFAAAAGMSAPCGGSAVSKLLDLAREGKWTAKDTIKALQELPK